MRKAFFKPFVGEHYAEGINGKKILVLGASFYCNHTECPFFAQCTSVKDKNSEPFDHQCPPYVPDGKALHLEPTYCIEDAPKTYQHFTEFMGRYLDTDDYDTVWDHLAFTNYVQFFLPAGDAFRETKKSDLSERDFEAFIEVVRDLKPDIVIIWGSVINSRLKEENEYLVDKQELHQTDFYVCHMQLPDMAQRIALINPYHPSSSAWYSGLEQFEQYLNTLLNL